MELRSTERDADREAESLKQPKLAVQAKPILSGVTNKSEKRTWMGNPNQASRPAAKKPATVTAEPFSAGQARYVRERQWAKDQEITESEDGSIVLKMKTSGWYDVQKWILSFGAEARVLEPAQLK